MGGAEGLRDALLMFRPDVVFHLAGRTPPASIEALETENAGMVEVLLGALVACGRACRVVVAGSAAEYGPVGEAQLPITEDYPCAPPEAYGRGKLRATRRAFEMAAGTGVSVVVGRLFNLIGPGMPAGLALGRFAAALAGPEPVRLVVGDLSPRRDFVDVRDAARALVRLGEGGISGTIYNVATGRSRSIREGLDRLLAISGRRADVEVEPARFGHPGPADSRGDPRRLSGLGWRPVVPFEQSLSDLWDEVRGRAAGEA